MTTKNSQKNDDVLINPDNVPTTYVAELLAMTPHGVAKLASNRTIRTNGRRGKYRLTEVIPAYIASIRGSDKAEADARLKVQQTRKLELANDMAAGKLVKVGDAAEAFRTFWLIYRAGIAALPRRVATQFSNESSPTKIQKALANEFAQLFYEMESGLRDYFAAHGETFAPSEPGGNGNSAPTKKKPRRVGRQKKNTTNRKRRTRKVAKR